MTRPRVVAPALPQAAAAAPFDDAVQAQALAALRGPDARRAIVALTLFATALFGPLIALTRNGWTLAALLGLVVVSVFRWAMSWQFERGEGRAPSSAQWPMLLLGQALAGASWAAVAGTAMAASHTEFATAVAVLGTAVVATAALHVFAAHRDACRAFVAPLLLMAPLAAILPGNLATLLAVAIVGTVALALLASPYAERAFVARTVLELRAAHQRSDATIAQRELERARAAVAAADLDRALLFDRSELGLALVADRRIVRVNERLASWFGRAPEAFANLDVLHLVAREHRDTVDALARTADAPGDSIEALLHADNVAAARWVRLLVPRSASGDRLWVFDDRHADALKRAADHARERTATSADPGRLIDRQGLDARLHAMDARGARVALIAASLPDWHRLSASIGPGPAERQLDVVAERLQAICRDEDAVIRFVGPTFAVLFAGDLDDDEVEHLRTRVDMVLDEPLAIQGRAISLRARTLALWTQLERQRPAMILSLLDDALDDVRQPLAPRPPRVTPATPAFDAVVANEDATHAPTKPTRNARTDAAPVAQTKVELITLEETPAHDA